jgi:uncharacterized membrane protein YdjX (TVP38/TMEM64 family)
MESTRNPKPYQATEAAHAAASRRRALLRALPLGAIVLALLVFYAMGAEDYLSLRALRHYRWILAAFVEEHAIIAPAAYFLLYVATVAVSFPSAGFLTIAGGFLFGASLGTVLAASAATLGATLVFLIARTSFGDLLTRRAGPRTQRLQEGFQEDSFSYLLFLRLVPLFPFWLVNLAAALFGMKLLPYVAATAIGILPTTFVLAYFGEGLATTIKEKQPLSLHLLVAFILLGLLALLPVGVRKWRRGRASESEAPQSDRMP